MWELLMAVYATTVQGKRWERLDLDKAIREACKHEQSSEAWSTILATHMLKMAEHLGDLIHQGKAPPLPPFIPKATFDQMPKHGPNLPNQEDVLASYAIIVNLVEWGQREFPEGTRVRIRFHTGGHQGETGVARSPPGPGGPPVVHPGMYETDMLPGALMNVLIDNDEHVKSFRMCDVTLEDGPP